MSGNTFGTIFRLTTYGESHGPGIGGVIDGCPAGLTFDEGFIQKALDERRPGSGAASTTRKEPDAVRILSGVFEGVTTGTPIAFHIDNTAHRSADYGELADVFRPGHADVGFHAKYGIRDYRGGGRSSGRETAARVAGGAVASLLLAHHGVSVWAVPVELGGIAAPLTDASGALGRPFYCPDEATVPLWHEAVAAAKTAGDSLGGVVHVCISGLPAGLGEPVFDKLDARLAYAFMGVGAVKGVAIGSGFAAARMRGSEHNDPIVPRKAGLAGATCTAEAGREGAGWAFASNNAGGILGGISTGADITATVAVKPIPSVAVEQASVNIAGEAKRLCIGGRHDVCAIPRIVPVLKAMAALCAADFLLLGRVARL